MFLFTLEFLWPIKKTETTNQEANHGIHVAPADAERNSGKKNILCLV